MKLRASRRYKLKTILNVSSDCEYRHWTHFADFVRLVGNQQVSKREASDEPFLLLLLLVLLQV